MATITRSKVATSRATSSTKKITKKTTTKAGTKITHIFPNGTEVTGTIEQLETIASALGTKLFLAGESCPRGYYPSESKGIVSISSMNDYHIRRALLKRTKDYLTDVFDKEDTNSKFLEKYTSLTEDNIIVDLFNELKSR